MPLRSRIEYSTKSESLHEAREESSEPAPDSSEFDLTLDDLCGVEDDAEVIESLDGGDTAAADAIDRPSKDVSDGDAELSKFVSAPVSKIVSGPHKSLSKIVSGSKRRSPENDAKTIAKMRSFRVGDVSAAGTSLVSDSSPFSSYDSFESYITDSPAESPKPANDNTIPVWDHIGDNVKAVCAVAALQIDDNPAIAFTFNLTPDAISKAKADPSGFLDALKRPFDQNLKRVGIALPYFFAVDIDDDGRLHLHGAFRYPAREISISLTRRIRTVMRDSWGEWIGPGKRKQVRFKTLYSDGWATYCLKQSKAVQKVIGPRTFTITQSLCREAKWAYGEIRRIIRGTGTYST